jgi:hypothetical protein
MIAIECDSIRNASILSVAHATKQIPISNDVQEGEVAGDVLFSEINGTGKSFGEFLFEAPSLRARPPARLAPFMPLIYPEPIILWTAK